MSGLITIAVPVYNERADLLAQALDSFEAQTYPDVEVIVVDDGSTDEGTLGVIEEHSAHDRVRVFRRERDSAFRSVSQAVNVALENARGSWWHHDAADCWLEPTWAADVMEFIAGREDSVGGVHTDFVTHHFDGHETHHRVRNVYDPKLSTFENYRRHESLGGWLFRMENARRAGPWDERFPRKQTREWTLRVLQLADLVYLPREEWHFIFHEADQMKRNASIKYRVLGDLKNGWPLKENMSWALSDRKMTLAMVEAFREFFQDAQWSHEREHSYHALEVARIREVTDGEASEDWDSPAPVEKNE